MIFLIVWFSRLQKIANQETAEYKKKSPILQLT